MKQTLVRYKIKPEEEQDNVRLIEDVFRELKARLRRACVICA